MRGIAFNNVRQNALQRGFFGEQHHPNACPGTCQSEQAQFVGGQRLAIEFSPRALALGARQEKRRSDGFGRLQRHLDCATAAGRRFKAHVSIQSIGQRRLHQMAGCQMLRTVVS